MGGLRSKIAITGGVAEGKSTVLAHLRDLGYRVASSDELAKDVFESSIVQAALAEILEQAQPVTPDDLRAQIWTDQEIRNRVNRVMHPEILAALEKSDAQFIEIPLLIETCLQLDVGRVWVVTCGPEEQLARLAQRFGDDRKAQDVIATQIPTEAKLAFADVIVRTNRPRADVNRFVAAMAGRSELQ